MNFCCKLDWPNDSEKVCMDIFVEVEKMGRIFEALRPHMVEFCDEVDPADLTNELMCYLRPGDKVGVHLF